MIIDEHFLEGDRCQSERNGWLSRETDSSVVAHPAVTKLSLFEFRQFYKKINK
jgi:hypothetical protein